MNAYMNISAQISYTKMEDATVAEPQQNDTVKAAANPREEPRSTDGEEENSLVLSADEGLQTDGGSETLHRRSRESTSSKKLTQPQTFFVLFKGMVAIGILYLPRGFAHAGWAFSLAAFVLCAFFTSEGLNRLVASHDRVSGSYSALTKRAVGNAGKLLLEISISLSQV